MSWSVYLPYLAVMAVVTYLVRMLPLTVFRKEIRSRFVKSFLYYVPYAVLTAMTIPDVLYCTGYTAGGDPQALWTALFGLAVAVFMAWRGGSLVKVAVGGCVAIALAQAVLLLI